jgi:excisionase family DNA binding protein
VNKSKKPAFAACNSEKPAEPSAAAKSVALPRPTLFTIKGACHDLSLSRTTILRMIELGELQTIRLSQRAIRIPATSIDRLLDL